MVMNLNIIVALLETKGIITHDEAEKLVAYLANSPQPTDYRDAISEVKLLLK
jgi:hypothetical protein